ncbi:thiol-disulfide isomerase/thioredoxin [Rhodoferax ferrireducens]|uniref:Thiol-disulfide isomerase/thioredoxin n=1 Tax=Rhodoferax ferrireducens TaxID=192843 RepID=A0ABU2CA54_9BURK|nr:thioredoxin family protein [Rhodoferax ferrireducens]MDR7378208.1 thiol-disulfide isomerase/thioredoxin [Rhodoferax ferrireducens]
MPQAIKSIVNSPTLWVACLCADWCGSCRDYQERFEQVGRSFPGAEFVWVDIEDQADLVDPIEVDNFPTLLVLVDQQVRFFGSITPQTETLQRLVQAQLESAAPTTPANPGLTALAQRLQAQQA